MERFAAPWDRTLRWTTGTFVAGTLAIAAALAARALTADPEGPVWELLGAAALLASATAGAWLLGPRGYAVGPEGLVVHRLLRPLRVASGELRSASLLPPGALAGALRVAGSGGAFGWYGRYWSRALGHFRLQATRREGLVLLEVGPAQRRVVLSPDRPEAFLAALSAAAPGLRVGSPPTGPAAASPGGGRGRWLALGLLLSLVPLLVAGILGAAWALAPVGATVEGGAVVVARRAGGPAVIPLAAVRSAAVLSPEEAAGFRRIAGTAMGSIRYGRFSSAALGRFQLHGWRSGPCVLLETAEGRVVLTPEDPEGFVARVRAGIAATAPPAAPGPGAPAPPGR